MLKGHVFSKQIFGNTIFALFINTFLNGKNGVSNNYKSGMAVTYSGSTLTVQSGAVCIQGRFLEEDTSTDIVAGTDTAYCKLVLEIDLSKENTESEFNQASYKIVKSTSGYPTLTQNDIVKNNVGVYQYELARFKTGTNGITDFQDMRTFLDFESIYDEIQIEYRSILSKLEKELSNVEDGSAYILKNNIATLRGIITLTGTDLASKAIDYPIGFNSTNSIVLAYGIGRSVDDYNYGNTLQDTNATFNANPTHFARLKSDNIQITARYGVEGHTNSTLYYKLVLMKYEVSEDEYTLGDVNGDGVIDETDLQMIQDYIMEKIVLTEQQFRAADMNEDGKVSSADYIRLLNQIASQYELGDVNMDGVVNQSDVDLVNNYLSGSVTLTAVQRKLADMNGDNTIDAMDTYLMIEKINGN